MYTRLRLQLQATRQERIGIWQAFHGLLNFNSSHVHDSDGSQQLSYNLCRNVDRLSLELQIRAASAAAAIAVADESVCHTWPCQT